MDLNWIYNEIQNLSCTFTDKASKSFTYDLFWAQRHFRWRYTSVLLASVITQWEQQLQFLLLQSSVILLEPKKDTSLSESATTLSWFLIQFFSSKNHKRYIYKKLTGWHGSPSHIKYHDFSLFNTVFSSVLSNFPNNAAPSTSREAILHPCHDLRQWVCWPWHCETTAYSTAVSDILRKNRSRVKKTPNSKPRPAPWQVPETTQLNPSGILLLFTFPAFSLWKALPETSVVGQCIPRTASLVMSEPSTTFPTREVAHFWHCAAWLAHNWERFWCGGLQFGRNCSSVVHSNRTCVARGLKAEFENGNFAYSHWHFAHTLSGCEWW